MHFIVPISHDPMQSAFLMHAKPSTQAGHSIPPQSTSVSMPFFAKSPHVAG